MNHSMIMTSMDPHAGHNMGASTVDPHAGHNMGTGTVDPHAGHNMATGTADPHAGHNMGSGMHMMMMYFHTELIDTVLFKGLVVNEAWKMAVACIILIFVAALYEGLKVFREQLLRRQVLNVRHQSHTISNSYSQEVMVSETHHTARARMCSGGHFLQTLLHMVQVFVSYLLMLVFMTYNVYLCLAVVIGAGMGYFLFGWKKSIVVDVNEHCH